LKTKTYWGKIHDYIADKIRWLKIIKWNLCINLYWWWISITREFSSKASRACMIRNPYLFGGFRSHKIMFHLSLLLYVGSGDHLFNAEWYQEESKSLILVPVEKITEERIDERKEIWYFIAENKDYKENKTSSLTPLKRITLISESHQRQWTFIPICPIQTYIPH